MLLNTRGRAFVFVLSVIVTLTQHVASDEKFRFECDSGSDSVAEQCKDVIGENRTAGEFFQHAIENCGDQVVDYLMGNMTKSGAGSGRRLLDECPTECATCEEETCGHCCLAYGCSYCSSSVPPSTCPGGCNRRRILAAAAADDDDHDDDQMDVIDKCTADIKKLAKIMNEQFDNWCYGNWKHIKCRLID